MRGLYASHSVTPVGYKTKYSFRTRFSSTYYGLTVGIGFPIWDYASFGFLINFGQQLYNGVSGMRIECYGEADFVGAYCERNGLSFGYYVRGNIPFGENFGAFALCYLLFNSDLPILGAGIGVEYKYIKEEKAPKNYR